MCKAPEKFGHCHERTGKRLRSVASRGTLPLAWLDYGSQGLIPAWALAFLEMNVYFHLWHCANLSNRRAACREHLPDPFTELATPTQINCSASTYRFQTHFSGATPD